MSPYIATLSETNTGVKCIYEEQFMIVQDFRSSDDKGVINSLNMNYNSSPLILELKMGGVDTSSTATMVNTYLELSSEIVIAEDGVCLLLLEALICKQIIFHFFHFILSYTSVK